MDVCNVSTPYCIRGFGRKVPFQNIFQPIREILAVCCHSIWLYPTGSDTHLFHVPCNCSLTGIKAFFMKFLCDFRSSVNALAIVMDMLDHIFDFSFKNASLARFAILPVIISTFGNAQYFKHSANMNLAFQIRCGLFDSCISGFS